MNKSKVAIVYCRNYEDNVDEKVAKAVELIGGVESIVNKEENILVKPNVLVGVEPDKAVTTHPSMMAGMFKLLINEGYNNITYGDGPGSRNISIEKAMENACLAQTAKEYDIPLGDFSSSVNVPYPQGKICRDFTLYKAAKDADAIISMCKMKTHALENITGAVKNQYGLVYSMHKAAGHAKYPNSKSFADMLADLDMCVRPRLYVMDGVIAMEGNGPGSGDPVPMKLILASTDPVALDATFAKLVYLDPAFVPTCVSGANAGLGTMNFDEIELVTSEGPISLDDAVTKFGNPKFNVKRKKAVFWKASILMPFRRKKKDKPVVDLEKCIGCGACQEACPVDGKAVHSGHGSKAVYDYKKCIRCYCCQEMCPVKAISKKG